MPVVRGDFSELLVPGARKVLVDEYNELPANYTELLNIGSSQKAYEDDHVVTGLGVAPERGEGEDIPFDRPQMRGTVRYTHVGYGLGYEITREAVEDEVYGALTSEGSRNLARSMRETESIVAWNILNNGFTSVTTYDGQPLFSDAHPGVGSLTFDNKVAVDISTAALKTAMEYFMNLQNDRGLRISLMPNKLFAGVANHHIIQEILGTQYVLGRAAGDPGTTGETTSIASDYTPNVIQSYNLMHVTSPYLTDDDAWFLQCPGHEANMFWRRSPDDVSGDDRRAGIAWFATTARWSVGVTEWRHFYGSTGA